MKKIFTILLLFSITGIARAQSVYQEYSYQFYQKLNSDVYSTKTRVHSALKPFFADDSLLKHHYDSLMNYGDDGKPHSWGYKKLFTEHLIDVKSPASTFYADLLPDFDIGRDFKGKLTTSTTSMGLQFGGSVSNKFYYNVAGYLSSAVTPEYLSTYINQTGIIPGQAYGKTYKDNGYDWKYITAIASYTPVKFLNISAGRDKTFIGDGYRSVLLSDVASPYPFFKLTATLGNVRYMAMWASFNDPIDLDANGNNRGKGGVFHYLDWNVSNRLSFGFFDAVIWYNKDDAGHSRPFDFSYINPVIFLRPVEASNGSPDNALIGFTSKYKLTDGITAYGQFALDEFESANFFSNGGSARNKYSYQLGIRGADLFDVKGLNYLLETNNSKPYTYSERGPIISYTENGEMLAHPWGANFREVVALLNYSYNRFDFSGEVDYGHYGLDINGLNYGKDPFEDYTTPAKQNGNYIGQGLTTNMIYLEGKIGYLLNPKYNLRLELGGIFRDEKNTQFNDKTAMLTIGLRSSFRSLYNDLASYKAH
ncbi:capsule assembly Wzi family protein [Mucilaginibacter sp. BJC16-A38]|uniref:capsule assembly Wzi family protein n=1 Tax=Mucilaginibacter phenanthrenivorans TaxID=1234842 RepID=UPI00215748BE|nr:capsule assembly Wzi family protein [Mucilaginibacter phenanthrenivorans]MCR8558470.1 capsule assembly Wzi family protein [Mucilaginibacter phenanthrenivorans]